MRRGLAVLALAVLLPGAGAARETRIRVPAGFRVTVFARGLAQPTAVAWGPDGRLYVTQTGGAIAAVDSTGRTHPFTGARGTPLGLVWVGRRLFVSETGRIERTAARAPPAGQHRRRRGRAALLRQRLDLRRLPGAQPP